MRDYKKEYERYLELHPDNGKIDYARRKELHPNSYADRIEYYQERYVKTVQDNPDYNRELYLRRIKLNPNIGKQNYEKRKKNQPNYGKYTIRFKGKQINLGYNPLTYSCVKCSRTVESGEIKITHLHHDKYDWNDPIAYTRELCVRCHNNFHKSNPTIPELNKP